MLSTCSMARARKFKVLLAIKCTTPEMWEEKLNWELCSAVGRGEWAKLALTNEPDQYHKKQCLCSGCFAGGCCFLAVGVAHLPFFEGGGLIFPKCGIVKKTHDMQQWWLVLPLSLCSLSDSAVRRNAALESLVVDDLTELGIFWHGQKCPNARKIFAQNNRFWILYCNI